MAAAEQQDSVLALFQKLDKDNSGEITKGEMAQGLYGSLKGEVEEQLGKNFFYEWTEYADLTKFGGGDSSHDSKIDIEEFRKWVGDRQKEIANEERIQALFEKLDTDDSNEITKGEMVKAMMGPLKADVEEVMGKNFFYQWTQYADVAILEGESEESQKMHDQKLGPGEFTAWVKDRQTFLFLSKKMQK